MMRPIVILSEQGAQYLALGQMWMYRNNLEQPDPSIENGAVVDIETKDGKYFGTGLYSAQSHICVRLLTHDRHQEINDAFFYHRIEGSYQFRKTLQKDNLDNCRLIFSEADGLPGLIADRYNDLIVTQISIYGMEIRKEMLYRALLKILKADGQQIRGIYERNEIAVRKKEGLPAYKGFYGDASGPTQTVISENGILMQVDIENGQKTGYFLDQKENRVLLRKMAAGKRVLDCFTHTGGFALNAAYGGASAVTAVDISEPALEQARHNAVLNHLEGKIRFERADVLEYLDTVSPDAFDIIVLDPPAFAKSRQMIDHAYAGYKRINRQAMHLLKNGGYLATCSCSRYMDTSLFEKMLREAAQEEGVILKQVSVTQQNSDHPILWTMEETSYLKFFIFQIICL